MGRGRRLAITGEENFQAWLANNWDHPLSDEVQRLQSEVKRLEAMHATDSRRLLKAESEWWSLIRKGFLACGTGALVHERLLGNERCAQRGVRVHRARGERQDRG